MNNAESEWRVYRTRFLVRAKKLTASLEFRDGLGREHRGQAGDYLIEASDGTLRIAQRGIFEDIYVAMGSAFVGPGLDHLSLPAGSSVSVSDPKRGSSVQTEMSA